MFRAVSGPSPPVVFAITGASGAPYAVRLLEVLATNHVPTWLLISAHGWRLLGEECGIKDEAGLKQATGGDWGCVRLFNDSDRGAEPASGSVKTLGMVVCPCSMGTLAASGSSPARSGPSCPSSTGTRPCRASVPILTPAGRRGRCH